MRHVNIPIFIPHLGCPNLCVFCNQRSISGKQNRSEENILSDAKNEIDEALKTIDGDCDTEIAFFGGSFTGIDRMLMINLLSLAETYIKNGRVKSIRMSTRPDYINDEILTILSGYSVKYIELGIQSMSDNVLTASKRGHTSEQSKNACKLIKKYGFKLIGQMMTGLPQSTEEDEISTAREIVNLGADGARIYPTMIFKGTELEKMALNGLYSPPDLDDMVARTSSVLQVFLDANVPVIKIGLHSGETLYSDEGITMSCYHPSMGELVEGEIFYKKMCELLQQHTQKSVTFCVAPNMISKAVGNGGRNKKRLIKQFGLSEMKIIGLNQLSGYEIILEKKQEKSF